MNSIQEPRNLQAEELIISPPPHIHSHFTRDKMFVEVITALSPVILTATGFIGISFLLNTLIILAGGLTGALLSKKILKRDFNLYDPANLVTLLVLSLSLPSGMNLIVSFTGGFLALFIGKYIFGDTGSNIFNPAMLSWAILSVVFPSYITGGNVSSVPFSGSWFSFSSEITTATPLFLKNSSLIDLCTGLKNGVPAELSILPVIAGGIYLLYRNIISYHLPTGFFTGIILSCIILNLPSLDLVFILKNIFSGGILFAAFFVITDPVTTPVRSRMRFLSGMITGIITIIIRIYTNVPEGIVYAVLFTNLITPVFNDPRLGMRK